MTDQQLLRDYAERRSEAAFAELCGGSGRRLSEPARSRFQKVELNGDAHNCAYPAVSGVRLAFATAKASTMARVDGTRVENTPLESASAHRYAAAMKKSSVFRSDPRVMHGAVVFAGTRVPLQNLIDYLEAGYSIDEFVDHFPSVTRKQAIRGLEEARRLLTAAAA